MFDLDPSVQDSAALAAGGAGGARHARASSVSAAGSRPPGRRASTSRWPMDSRDTVRAPFAVCARGRRAARQAQPNPSDARVSQVRSARTHSGRHRSKCVQRNLRRAVRGARASGAHPSRRPARGKKWNRERWVPNHSSSQDMPARVAQVGDLWADLHAEPASLEGALQKLSRSDTARGMAARRRSIETQGQAAQADGRALKRGDFQPRKTHPQLPIRALEACHVECGSENQTPMRRNLPWPSTRPADCYMSHLMRFWCG